MSRKMSSAEKAYLKQTVAWFNAQEFAIKSCDLNIAYQKQVISMAKQTIKLEQKEKDLKLKTLTAVKKQLAAFKKELKIK